VFLYYLSSHFVLLKYIANLIGFKCERYLISDRCESNVIQKKIIRAVWVLSMMQDRIYEKKRQLILRFIKKHGKADHSFILNEIDVDYGTLMKIISELRREGQSGPKTDLI
jgi:hypothetical protein